MSATVASVLARKYVRINRVRESGMVEFLFAIGDPELSIELIMERAMFDEFCAQNQVVLLDDAEQSCPADGAKSDWDWTLSDATRQRFKNN
jgi:phenol hydroxylase P0 protein